MSVTEKVRLKHEPIKEKIGSRILNSKDELLSGTVAGEIREQLEARGVLVFPEIKFTHDEQVAFTKTLGTFAPEMHDKAGEEAVHPITLDEKINPTSAAYLKGSLYWHIDGTMNERPILASLLQCEKPSPKGTGNTGFANTYAAYDALPADKKAEFESYKVRHGAWATLFYYDPEPSQQMLERMQAIGDVELPLVWSHKSGRKSLVIGATARHVVDMDFKKSAELLVQLRDWATQPQVVYRHTWSVGDLVIWDNTGTMHRATPYDPASGRLLHRTKLEGEEAFA